MSNCGRSRNNVDTRLIGFPPRTTVRGGNDIAILHHLYLPAPPCFLACTSRLPENLATPNLFIILSGKRLANIIIAD